MNVKAFSLESDLDFYCFLKINLPAGYEIIAEPQKDYHSEWQFCYKVYRDHALLKTYEGDFSKIPAGSLVQSAAALLAECKEQKRC